MENQASDRAYRIGQKKSVQVIKLVTEGTIEEKIIKIQEIKDIIFCRSNAEKYVEIKYENQIVRIEYSNKKVEDEFKKILQKVLTNQHYEK